MQNAQRFQVALRIRQATVCALLPWAVACQTATQLPAEIETEPETPAAEPHDVMHAPTQVDSSSQQNGSAGDGSGAADKGTSEAPSLPDMLIDEDLGGPAAPNASAACDSADPSGWAAPLAGETCYEFLLHNESSASDVSKYVIEPGERVVQLYYAVPWPAGQVATRFGAQLDDVPVVREWVAFGTDEQQAPGTVSKNVTGTTLGTNAKMFARGSTGSCNVVMPDDLGLELPGQDKSLMIQWLQLSTTDSNELDGSKVLVCTVPASERANIASFTWLGTENLNALQGMPAGVESTFDGTCENRSGESITIAALWPHMHALGTHAATGLLRAGGAVESILDTPFHDASESHYELSPRAVLESGDKIRATCTYFNSTPYSVGFGISKSQETCTQLALAYPAGALDKPGNLSLIGATNTCWGD